MVIINATVLSSILTWGSELFNIFFSQIPSSETSYSQYVENYAKIVISVYTAVCRMQYIGKFI